MNTSQIILVHFNDGKQYSIIIEERHGSYTMKVSSEGTNGQHAYPGDNNAAKLYQSATDAFRELADKWDISSATQVTTTNEFFDEEFLKDFFPHGDVRRV